MSPLNRRLPRELRHNLGKYVGLFFLICLTIAMCSGFLTAARSIERVIADTQAQANLQDFSFTTQFKADDDALDDVRALGGGIQVVEDFYGNLSISWNGQDQDQSATARTYGARDEIDKVTYYSGRAPETGDEIALDRNFMESNGLELGDRVTVNGHELTIVGQVVMPDYQCMMRNNTDPLFDNQDFTVAQVTGDSFDEIVGDAAVFHYVARFDDRDLSLADRTTYEKDVMESLADDGVTLTDLVDREANQAIAYVDDDLQSDAAGWEIMLFLLIFISAFIFVVLTDATVEQESAVIGTLLASGYRKGELVRHYMVLPVIVGVLAAAVGNVIGYTWLVDIMANLYYHSYSLPTFHAYFDTYTFVETTVVPLVLLIVITLIGIRRKLSASPLAFLRHEVGRTSRRASANLPERWNFMRRFRTRVFLRNASHFAILFLGIMFSSILMLFGIGMMPVVNNAADLMASSVRAEHIYLLKAPLEIDETDEQREAAVALKELQTTENPLTSISMGKLTDLLGSASSLEGSTHAYNDQENDADAIENAEKFCATSLEVEKPKGLARGEGSNTETVTVYGVEVGSSYWDDLDVSGGKIVIGAGLAEKCDLELGYPVTFTDKYTDTSYVLAPVEIAGNSTDTNVYMSIETFKELFADLTDGDPDWFNGYASDAELNLDERYVAGEITPSSMRVMANQMESSMGDIMTAMLWVVIPIAIVLIYLLTKTVIDRSARAISYMKVFGYHSREIDKLYLRPVTWAVIGSYVISIPLVVWITAALMRVYMASYGGNIEFTVSPVTMGEVLAIGIVTYLVVAAIHVVRIRHVPLALALKVQE